jgi:D-aminopeptidase
MSTTNNFVSKMLIYQFILLFSVLLASKARAQTEPRKARDLGIEFGVLKTGSLNALTDVPGVRVGHQTIINGQNVRTGVTVIIPHKGNIFQSKVPAGIYVGNGFGKLAGSTQVEELGLLETPIALTNTLSVPDVMKAIIKYTLEQEDNKEVRSVNAVVGETNDGYLNDIRGFHVTENDVLEALKNASDKNTSEGNIGAGTGTRCFGFKGGIGTSSRILPSSLGGYTVGVLVQSNFGGTLKIGGIPVGKKLNKYPYRQAIESSDGSCMIVIATDAPVDARNLKRLAERSMLGLARTGGIASNGSGDYAIAFSTAVENRVSYQSEPSQSFLFLNNDSVSPLFLAVIEATEEAIINSLFAAETMTGFEGNTSKALPIKEVLEILNATN